MWKRYVLPTGRLGRGGFWLGLIALLLLGGAVSSAPEPYDYAAILLGWPWFCILVNRLHDKGHTGLRLAIPIIVNLILYAGVFVFIVLGFASGFHPQSAPGSNLPIPLLLTAAGIACLIVIYDGCYLLWLGLTAGTAGDNRFGPRAGRSPGG